MTDNALGVNDYYPGGTYLIPAELAKKWPIKNADFIQHTAVINVKGFDSLDLYIRSSKDKGLTHLVVDDKITAPFLRDVFLHDEKYPYLTKVFDSEDHGYKAHVKVYKIDYAKMISNS